MSDMTAAHQSAVPFRCRGALAFVWPVDDDAVRPVHDVAARSRRGIKVVLAIAAAAVLMFNTAAIVAMLKHYDDDKEFIYGLDIKHLDEIAQAQS